MGRLHCIIFRTISKKFFDRSNKFRFLTITYSAIKKKNIEIIYVFLEKILQVALEYKNILSLKILLIVYNIFHIKKLALLHLFFEDNNTTYEIRKTLIKTNRVNSIIPQKILNVKKYNNEKMK